ncbi:unnamed protein product [Alopecurus aequalis]
MATEEEAREAADGEEVQVEAADLGTAHLKVNLDSKISSHEEIKGEAKIMDSTEGLLKVTEDQVSEKAPSAVEIPPEHTPNGTASSLNGHMKEEKTSNEIPQENGQKDNEPVEASSNGISTDQSSRSNGEEAVSSSGHVESTTEDTSLLKHAEDAAAEHKLVHEDTLQTDEPTTDAQQGQNMEPAEVTEDTQHASTSCIPHDEVVAEAPAGVQTSLEPNVDDSEALPDATDGNTEDENIAEHPDQIVKLEDQPSEQTDDVGADLVQEEVPKSKKTDVPEDMTTTEQANDLMNGHQEEVKKELPEETSNPVREKTEETSHESDVSASEETTPEHDAATREPAPDVQEVQNQGLAEEIAEANEVDAEETVQQTGHDAATGEPALDVQEVQNQGLAEEIAEAKEVDTEETVQQSGVAFEEATPDDNVATIEPSSDIQHLDNAESEETKGLEDAKAEETSNQSNVTISKDAAQDKEATEDIQPVQGLEEEPKSTETVEMEQASNQPHAVVLNNLSEEDGVPACQPQLIESEEDVKDTGVTETQESHAAASEELVTEADSMAVESQNADIQQTLEQGSLEVKETEAPETQEICHERTISASEEDSVEDLAAEGPTCDTQEAEILEAVEEITDNTAENIVEASNVATTEESIQENNVIASEDVCEQQTRELEPEEIENTEPVETEEDSDQRDPALLNDPAPEDIIPSDILQTESTAEVTETEATEIEALPHESNVSTSEEPASEESITASEITCDAQEVNNLEPAEVVEGNKDTGIKEISDQSNERNVAGMEEMATEDNTTILTDASIQQLQEEEPVEFRDTEVTEPQGISPSHIVSTSEESTPEDNVTAEPSPDTEAENLESATVTEETKDVESTDAIAEEETPEEHVQEFEAPVHTPPVEEPELEETKNNVNQMDAAILENPTHEDKPIAAESLVIESAEVSSSEATEGQEMPQSAVTQSEDHETEDNTTASEPEILEPEPVEEVKDTEATEVAQIHNESGEFTEDVERALADEAAPDEDAKTTEAAADMPQAQEPELEEIKNTEPDEEKEDISARDLPEEEVKETEATETEVISEGTDANISEPTEDAERNVALADEVAPEEHVIETETTVDIPRAQEPEIGEIKTAEPIEVEENISATDQPADEIKATEVMETEAINESTDIGNSDFALEDEAAHEEHVIATETTVHIPRTQEPDLEEIKNTERGEVKEDISASDLPAEHVKETETIVGETAEENLESATVVEETKDVKSADAITEEETPEEHVQESEAPVDIPPVEEPELEETKNTEPVEVHDNVTTDDQPAEEVKDTEATEIAEIHNESDDLTEDDKSKVTLADEAAPEEDAKATEATAGIPQSQEPELEEIKKSEPVEVEDNIIASDLPAEEIKDTEAMETETIPDASAGANTSELTDDVKSNVALGDEAAPEEYVIAAEATTDIPRAQELEREEIKDTEPVEVEENISATNQSAEEIKAMETEAINESIDANSSEPTEDVKRTFSLEDEAAHEEHVIAAETTVQMPRAQEPELEEIKNNEPVEVKEDILASDLPAEEVKETEAPETEVISESTDANISEPTEDAEKNVALADEAAPGENVIAPEATVDIPRAQEPELEEINNAEHVEVEEIISENDLPAEEVKDTETVETEEINDRTDANITELTEDVARADEAVPDIHVDIPPAQKPAVEEINNTEPVEAEDSITADDIPAEETNDTKATETEEITHESSDDSLTASAPLVDIQQIPEQEVEDKKCTDTAEYQGETQQTIVSTADELTPTEEGTTVTEPTRDTHVQNATTQEIEDGEVAAQESPLLGGEVASSVQQVLQRDSTEETREIEAVQTEDDQQDGVSNLEKPVSESNGSESEQNVADQEVQEDKSAEVNDTEAMETEEISTQDNIPTNENAAQESSEPVSDPDLLVQSEDSRDQLVKAEETGQINGASLDVPTAEDNTANETDLLAHTKEANGLESVEGNKGIDATEGEEASHPSQDAGLEELVSESIVATIESTSDIQQVNDLDEAKEMTATEAIDDEETSCKKTEVATLEDTSTTDDGTSPKQKDEPSDLGEKTALTTQEGESPTEEDVVQVSGEDTVGISNNIEKIKEQSKAVIEHNAIQSGDHTNDQDNEQVHDAELQMQVCERSLDVSAIEQPDEDIQKVNLDQQQNEHEAIEKQTAEIQRDEQTHADSSTELTTETLMEPQSNEIGTINLHENTDVEAEQTETVATEMLMNEQTQHISQGSIPSIADVEAEKSTEIKEMSEQANEPNNTDTLYADAEDEKENIAKPSTKEHDGTIAETINEEYGNGLASAIEKDLQETSDTASSNEEILENNVEPRVHREEEERINKANDDMQAIQASEEEVVDEVEEKQEMENEDTDVSNDEIQTKSVDEEASVLHSNDSTDTKVDDTMSPYAELVQGRVDAQPAETEEVEENKGFSSISEYVAEKSKQNDVEQDLRIHPKVVDDNLAIAEQNGAEVETNLNEEMANSYTAVTEAVKVDEAIDDKASGADGALSHENIETFEDNRTNLEASALGESMNGDKEHHNLALPEQASASEVTERGLLFPEKPLSTESEEHEESQTTKEQHEEDTHEQETGDTEKEAEQSDLPVSNFLMNLIMGKQSTEPEENLEFEAEKKQEETTKDDSCLITSQQEESLVPIPADLKVDNKPIFEEGKHNLEGSEETHDFKLESEEELSRNTHDSEAPVCQNNVQGEISSELVPGGPGMMTELETREVKLGETATNSVCQEHIEAGKQIEEGSLKSNLDNSTNPKASQDDTLEEGRTDLQHESLPEDRSSDAVAGQTLLSTEPDMGAEKKLPNDTEDLPRPLSTKREESTESSIIEAESTIKEELENKVEKEEDKQHTTNTGGATEGQIEKSHDNSQNGIEAISDEQTGEMTVPAMGTEINLVHEKDISAGSECKDEEQSYKSSNSELDNSEKTLEIQSDGSSLHINQDKQDEFAGGKIVMEDNNLLDKPGESILQEEQETEIGKKSPKESDEGDQNCLAIREPVMKEENVNRTVESHMQTVNTESNKEQETLKSEVQEHDLDVVSAKEAPETEENVVEMTKPEFSTDEEQSPKKDKSNMAGEKTYVEKTKDEEEAKSFTGEATTKTEEQGAVPVQKVSQRDLNVVLPTEAPGSEESYVDVKKPDFSTDEEQSPKKDESNMAEEKSYDEKTNGDKEAKNFTDEAPTKIEEREAGQKASPKKQNILSGVGSKVKHQLAKVKKAIIGKPGHTKSELAKS